jgi:hypothetical protein
MSRYIDAEKLDEHKFLGVTYDRYVTDGSRKSEEEIYAYKVGYNDAIDGIVQFAPTADVVDKERYVRARENADILSDALSEYQSADMVEVVRCKDCKHLEILNGECVFARCNRHDFPYISFGNADTRTWFCADGERRTE